MAAKGAWTDYAKGVAGRRLRKRERSHYSEESTGFGSTLVCINKDSSAELSEAINSMFAWYRLSKQCYVFLPDVYDVTVSSTSLPEMEIRQSSFDTDLYVDLFCQSIWFSRAWTLQELLAPRSVEFFNAEFHAIDSRTTLAPYIKRATGIDLHYLTGAWLPKASVGQRLAWASHRKATRPEDIAYSLIGLLGVNIPLLYGEGQNALLRLQTEVIRTSDDESIFAWMAQSSEPVSGWQHEPLSGLLANRIQLFQPHNERMAYRLQGASNVPRLHYDMTNKGLRMSLPLPGDEMKICMKDKRCVDVLLPLNCVIHGWEDEREDQVVAIIVRIEPQDYDDFSQFGHCDILIGRRYRGALCCRLFQSPSNGKREFVPNSWFGPEKKFDMIAGIYDGTEANVQVYFTQSHWITITLKLSAVISSIGKGSQPDEPPES